MRTLKINGNGPIYRKQGFIVIIVIRNSIIDITNMTAYKLIVCYFRSLSITFIGCIVVQTRIDDIIGECVAE